MEIKYSHFTSELTHSWQFTSYLYVTSVSDFNYKPKSNQLQVNICHVPARKYLSHTGDTGFHKLLFSFVTQLLSGECRNWPSESLTPRFPWCVIGRLSACTRVPHR